MPQSVSMDEWDRHRGVIRSNTGGWRVGQGVVSHGYGLFDELAGKASFVQVLVLNVTGRMPERRFADWLEATFICSSWPDPRIWCNQISALGGAAHVSCQAAVSMGLLASDSRLYGPGTVNLIMSFLDRVDAAVTANNSIPVFIEQEIKTRGGQIPGFARPVAAGDQRVAVMQKIAADLGFQPGPSEKMLLEIQRYLFHLRGDSMNIAGYMGGFMRDQGYSAKELCRMLALSVSGGLHACYSEYRDKPAETFLPLHCEDIEYTGPAERSVPIGS